MYKSSWEIGNFDSVVCSVYPQLSSSSSSPKVRTLGIRTPYIFLYVVPLFSFALRVSLNKILRWIKVSTWSIDFSFFLEQFLFSKVGMCFLLSAVIVAWPNELVFGVRYSWEVLLEYPVVVWNVCQIMLELLLPLIFQNVCS